jgi:hypothetical protein
MREKTIEIKQTKYDNISVPRGTAPREVEKTSPSHRNYDEYGSAVDNDDMKG